MDTINKILPSSAPHRPEPADAGQRNSTVHDVSRSAPIQQTDHADLSTEWNGQDNADILVRQMLSAFQDKYPGISILLSGELDRDSLRSAAVALGEGNYLILSESFFEKMKSSQDAYEKGKSILVQMLSRLSSSGSATRAQGFYLSENEALYWSADTSAERNAQVQPEPNKGAFPWNSTGQNSPGFSSSVYSKTGKVSLKVISRSYNNLAGARTKGQVQTVMSRARRDISNLRLSACFGDNQERMKAKAAISSMQKLLQRGSRKIRRLNEAELTALRQKRAQKRQEHSRELQLMLERKKMETRRRTADECIRKEGQLEEINQSFRFRRYNKYGYDEKAETIPTMPVPALSQDIPIAQDAGAPALTAADISISPVPVDISFV